MIAYALGEMGMTMQDFCSLSLNEYKLKVKGHQVREAVEWDRVRHIMFYQVATAPGRKRPIRHVSEVLSIPVLDKKAKGSKNHLMLRHLQRAVENAATDEERMKAQLRLVDYEQNYL